VKLTGDNLPKSHSVLKDHTCQKGPTILGGMLKGKRAKTSDGKDLGKIDKVSQNYIRLEKDL
jgi:hypothetical protein